MPIRGRDNEGFGFGSSYIDGKSVARHKNDNFRGLSPYLKNKPRKKRQVGKYNYFNWGRYR